MEKSYVTMEQKVCEVCGKTYDTNAILMDRRLRPTFDMHTTTGWGLCPEHEKLYKDGYVALVVVKNAGEGRILKREEADRTGEVIHMRRTVAEKMFNLGQAWDEIALLFIDQEIAERLHKMVK